MVFVARDIHRSITIVVWSSDVIFRAILKKKLDDVQMAFLARGQHRSLSKVTWSPDVIFRTILKKKLDGV